ncbi:MAG: acyl carrier protein [Jatrophihabitantaceae bacterium]
MSMSQDDVEQTIRAFLIRVDKVPETELTSATALFADGIGLDSLETAELSAMLEDEFGTDPFSAETMPQTVGDIVAFYAADTAGSDSVATQS